MQSHKYFHLSRLTATALTVTLLLISGCANGYAQFYQAAYGVTPEVISSQRVAPPPAVPAVERTTSSDLSAIGAAYGKRGYVMIGFSSFNAGGNVPESQAIEQGKKVGADIVLIANPHYTGSISSSVPITTPTTTTSYTTTNFTAYGAGGTVNAFGNATTTTSGSKTTYMPIVINRSDYGAVYLVKTRMIFGAFARELNDKERQEVQTNHGLVIMYLVDNGAAFHADILPGDILLDFNGTSVPTSDFSKFVEGFRGQTVNVAIWRNGQRISKAVQLP